MFVYVMLFLVIGPSLMLLADMAKQSRRRAEVQPQEGDPAAS